MTGCIPAMPASTRPNLRHCACRSYITRTSTADIRRRPTCVSGRAVWRWNSCISRHVSWIEIAMNKIFSAMAISGWLATPALAGAADSLIGFDAAASSAQLAVEKQLDAGIDSADLRGWLKDLAAAPNHVGSAHDRRNAEKIRDMLASWGWNARIETFQVLYPTPLAERVELVAPVRHVAQLLETPLPGDAGSAVPGALPAYNAYGADGDVTAEVVYVNFGMDADYLELARRGVSVSGKIVLARYGGGWRGLKAKLAHEHGAVGCLIYSDPHEDGYAAGDAYPEGGWRPANGIQRGSVDDIPLYPGDPLTPGVGATAGATRLAIKDATTLMKIPVVPIS